MKKISNNKGFSLVELIIVVAIMAVLIGVLAPQYLKYVEKSRVTADQDSIDALKGACETIVTDPDTEITGPFTVTINNEKTEVDDETAGKELEAIMSDYKDSKLKSKSYKEAEVKIVVTWEEDPNNEKIMLPKIEVKDDPVKGEDSGN